MWHSTIRLATAQGLVSLFTAIDVVMVSILPVRPDAAASYQASATVSRVPVWLAMGIGTAFFPSLSRRIRAGQLAGRAVQLYAIVALPLLAVLLTVPPTVLATAFPAKFGEMATLLKFTAVTGLASGGITLATAFFQAADDYAFLWWLGGGMGGFVIGLIGGWWLGGITGLAAGGAISVSILFILVGYRVARRQGNGVFAHVSLTTPAVSAVILVALRAYPVPWLIAAIAVGFLAGLRFLSGTASPGHARSGRIGLRQLVGRKAGEVVAVLRQHRLEEPDAVEPILGQHVPRAQPPSFTGIDDTRT